MAVQGRRVLVQGVAAVSEMAAPLSSDNTNAVFIDTNLDTHFAIFVSHNDTVSDLKKRIELEHPSCFPRFGHIHIHGIKAMRNGCFYHLSDSLFVRNVFTGFNMEWFLSVEASALVEEEAAQSDQLIPHASPNQVACHGIAANDALVCHGDNSTSKRVSSLDNLQLESKQDQGQGIHNVSPCVLETGVKSAGNNEDGIPVHGSIPEVGERGFVNHEVLPSLHIECEVDGSGTGIKDVRDVREDDLSISVPRSKTKQKRKRKREDPVPDDNSNDNVASVDNPLSRPSKRKSSMNNSQVPLLEKNQDENEEVPVVGNTVQNLESGVKSSGNNDPVIAVTSSLPETRDNCSVNHELPNSHIECAVDGSSEGIKEDSIVLDEGMCKTAPATKKRHKSKRKKEDTVQGDNSKDNIASVDNPPSKPSKRTSSMNNSQVPQLEKKQDENEEVPVVGKVVKNLEIDVKFTGASVECALDGSNKDINEDSTVPDEGMCKTASATKKRQKSKRKKEDTVQGDNSKDNITSVDNPLSSPSQRTSRMNNSQVPLLEKKQDEDEEVPVIGKVSKNLEIDVKSSGNNDPGISVTSSLPETQDNCCVNHELPNSHIECAVDGSNEGITEDSIVPDEGMCKSAPATKKRKKSKRKKEDTVQGDNTKDNITSVDNPQLENKQDKLNKQNVGAEEGRALSTENDPNLEKATLFKQDSTNANIKELNASPEVMDVSGKSEPVKSEKKTKKTRKAKNSGRELAHREGIDFVLDASKSETVVNSLKATNCDPMSRNISIEENPLSQSKGGENQQEDRQQIVLSVAGKEDDFIMDSAGSLEQIKTKSNAEHLDELVDMSQRKKSNNKQTCTSKDISNLLTKDQFVDSQKECDVPKIHPDKKVRNVHKTRQDAKLSSQSDSAMSSVKVNRKPPKSASGGSMYLENRKEHLLLSNSKLESSNKMVKNKAGKASGKNVEGVMYNIQQRKSLLAGGIFNDDSSWTSLDEADDSDVSTRTPLVDSLVSDFSDGDSSADLDSQQNGAYGGDRMENGGESSLKASSSGTKGIPMDLLFKSSSMYKKAKLTSQLDLTESQPEFVPDSLADKESS